MSTLRLRHRARLDGETGSGEAVAKQALQRWRQGDFWDQHQSLFTPRKRLCNETEIDLGLSAARHAKKQAHPESGEPSAQVGEGAILLGRQAMPWGEARVACTELSGLDPAGLQALSQETLGSASCPGEIRRRSVAIGEPREDCGETRFPAEPGKPGCPGRGNGIAPGIARHGPGAAQTRR